MENEEKPVNGGSKDPLDELGDRVREKLATGRFVFDNLFVPKAKEVFEKAKSAAEGQLNKVRDSLDPTRGLARNAVDTRNWLMEKGFSLKRANEAVVETVAKVLKETKPETKKPRDVAQGKEEKKNA